MTTTAEEKNITCNNCHGHEDGCQYCNYTGHRKWRYSGGTHDSYDVYDPEGNEFILECDQLQAQTICDKFNALEKLSANVPGEIERWDYSTFDGSFAIDENGYWMKSDEVLPVIAQLRNENNGFKTWSEESVVRQWTVINGERFFHESERTKLNGTIAAQQGEIEKLRLALGQIRSGANPIDESGKNFWINSAREIAAKALTPKQK